MTNPPSVPKTSKARDPDAMDVDNPNPKTHE